MNASQYADLQNYYILEQTGGYGSELERYKSSLPKNSVARKASQGDVGAMIDLMMPTHIGVRTQVEYNFPAGPQASGSVGFQITYSRRTNRIAFHVDVAPEGGYSWMPPVDVGLGNPVKVGASATTGVVIGWFASDVDSVTSGTSPIVSGSFAFGPALSASVSPGSTIDPVYGTAPTTFYFGGGGGCCYAGVGGGVSIVPKAINVPGLGPIEFQKIIEHPIWR